MAKKITGCGWAYEVIEGMDTDLQERFGYVKSGTLTALSAFMPRSSAPLKREDNIQKFDHLSPNAYNHYAAHFLLPDQALLDAIKTAPLAPRPKIVVVDMVWSRSDDLMPDKAIFLTEECSAINSLRCRPWIDENTGKCTNPFLVKREAKAFNSDTGTFEKHGNYRYIDHGAACVGALRISDKKHSHKKMIRGYIGDPKLNATKEANLWNLSSRADIVLLPARGHAKIEETAYRNALLTAKSTGLISEKEHEAFGDIETYDLLMAASKSEKTKTTDLLIKEVIHLFDRMFSIHSLV